MQNTFDALVHTVWMLLVRGAVVYISTKRARRRLLLLAAAAAAWFTTEAQVRPLFNALGYQLGSCRLPVRWLVEYLCASKL
eukprot:6104032-Amphidinium_carterae.1